MTVTMSVDDDRSHADHRVNGLLAITPARNEGEHLGRLITAMTAMTRRPDRWVIVDDGSSDHTGALACAASAAHDWIVCERTDGSERRADWSKARRVNSVVARHAGPDTDVIVVFDADIEPPADYLEHVATAFATDATLGVFGGVCNYPDHLPVETEAFPADIVPGGAAAIRTRTWHDIDGFWELPHGGLDVAACLAAQMRGWTTRNDHDLVCLHHRRMGTAEGRSPLRSLHRRGREDHDLGAALWFEIGKALRRLHRGPIVLGSAALMSGYLRARITRAPHTPPPEFVAYVRSRGRRRTLAPITRALRRYRRSKPVA